MYLYVSIYVCTFMFKFNPQKTFNLFCIFLYFFTGWQQNLETWKNLELDNLTKKTGKAWNFVEISLKTWNLFKF